MNERLIIGIDCAVDPKNVGVAYGFLSGDRLTLKRAKACSKKCLPAQEAAQFAKGHEDVLFALDAPLGWPHSLGMALSQHEAGRPFELPANRLFRRETDDFVAAADWIKKRPLDVGADRIGRTAHGALDLLRAIAEEIGQPLELAWSKSDRGPRAIEVYPAATLKAHRIGPYRYRKQEEKSGRRTIFQELHEKMKIDENEQTLTDSAHVLDAAVCVLAGADFLRGYCSPPKDPAMSMKEGWIWVRDPSIAPLRP